MTHKSEIESVRWEMSSKNKRWIQRQELNMDYSKENGEEEQSMEKGLVAYWGKTGKNTNCREHS